MQFDASIRISNHTGEADQMAFEEQVRLYQEDEEARRVTRQQTRSLPYQLADMTEKEEFDSKLNLIYVTNDPIFSCVNIKI